MTADPLHPFVASQRQRSLILRLTRFGFFIAIVTVALVTLFNEAGPPGTETGISLEVPWWLPVAIALGIFLVAIGIDFLTPNKKIATISGVFLGLFAGLLAAVAMSLVIDLVLNAWLPGNILAQFKAFSGLIKLFLGIALCYLGIVTVLQTQDDFRLVIPYVEFAKQIRGVKPLLLDTSALIDGRIVDLASTGLLQSPIVIPRFVIAEMQTLADSQDKLKRARGRRGLDAVGRLQRTGRVDVTIEDVAPAMVGVDQALVDLAQQLSARILTTDMGLTRVAQIHGVIVLNMHEIAASLRPALLPGEQISLSIIKSGEQPGQGVGYLEDGTMVVVEHAASRIGTDVFALVVSTMQTNAGRLVFARLMDVVRSPAAAPAPLPAADAPHDAHAGAEHPPLPPTHEDEPGRSSDEQAPAAGAPAAPGAHADATGEAPSGAARPPRSPFPPSGPARREPTGRNPRR